MKQPLMLIPPAQAEVLSDTYWAEFARDGTQIDDRFAAGRWLDDDLPEDSASPHTTQVESSRIYGREHMRAA